MPETDNTQLRTKYLIFKADGSRPKGNHCYFVLDIDNEDPVHRRASRNALEAYAAAIRSSMPVLAVDIYRLLEEAAKKDMAK